MAIVSNRHTVPAWRLWLWGVVAGLLLLPLAAMQFTREVNWTVGDFVAAAVLLGGGAVALEWAMRTIRGPGARPAAAAAILLVLVLVWLQLAVGII